MITLVLKGTGAGGTDEACSLSYDSNGNLGSKTCGAKVTNYSWDAQDRLIGLSGPGMQGSFSYDALGRRTSRTVNGVATTYVYDAAQAVAETINGQDARLLTGLNLDEAIARYSASGNKTWLADALGSVIAEARDDRTIATRREYTPYGQSVASGETSDNATQYTGRENDGTGLYFYRARYYDPVGKRFIQADPIGLAGGINSYAYVGGNPISYIDPQGLWSTSGHNQILLAFAAQTGMTVSQRQAMMAGSAAADAGKYQDDKHSFMHAMSSSKLSKRQACELARDFVRGRIHRATEDIGRFPGLLGPYWQLGFGLHTVMDSTSPAHRDFSFWTNWVAPIHGPFPTSIENHPSPAQVAATVKRMIDAVNGVHYFNCDCY